jgi:hypothetical protein
VGFVGGLTIGVATPAGGSLPLASHSVPVPTTAHAPASTPPISEQLEPADAGPSAAEPDAPVVAREAAATQNAARAKAPTKGSKAQPSTPAAPRSTSQQPPMILGIRY